MVGSYLETRRGARTMSARAAQLDDDEDEERADALVDKVALDELDREGTLAHTASADDDELVLAQKLGLRARRDRLVSLVSRVTVS